MKITAIHSKKTGSTKTIATLLISELQRLCPAAEIREFYAVNTPSCIGCFSCFANGEETCPHYHIIHPVMTAIEEADIIILDSPVYCLGISGALKNVLEHMAYRWFAHRPHPSMSTKIGVAISTTGSAGARSVGKALQKNFFGWSLAKSYRLSYAVMGTGWDDIAPRKKQKIIRHIEKTAARIAKQTGKARRSLYLRMILRMMRLVQKNNTWFPLDKAYWTDHGWIK